MLATVDNRGTRAEIRLAEMIVVSEYVDVQPQPWGGLTSYRYRVTITASEGGYYTTHAYGSNMDYTQGVQTAAAELGWMVLGDLLDAYYDPEEFFSMAIGEPDDIDLERVRGILEIIDYAAKIGRVLEINESDIREAQDQ